MGDGNEAVAQRGQKREGTAPRWFCRIPKYKMRKLDDTLPAHSLPPAVADESSTDEDIPALVDPPPVADGYSADEEMPALEAYTPRSTAQAEQADSFRPSQLPIFSRSETNTDMPALETLRPTALAERPDFWRLYQLPVFRRFWTNTDMPALETPRPTALAERPHGNILPPGTPLWDLLCPHCRRSAEVLPSREAHGLFEHGCRVHGDQLCLAVHASIAHLS